MGVSQKAEQVATNLNVGSAEGPEHVKVSLGKMFNLKLITV